MATSSALYTRRVLLYTTAESVPAISVATDTVVNGGTEFSNFCGYNSCRVILPTSESHVERHSTDKPELLFIFNKQDRRAYAQIVVTSDKRIQLSSECG